MQVAGSYLMLAFATIAWIIYNGFVWWMGYEEQLRPRWGSLARVAQPPAWVLYSCGVHGRVETLNLPMAIAQMSAVVGVVMLPLTMAYYVLVLGSPPFHGISAASFMLMTLISPLIPCLTAEAIMWRWQQKRRR